MRNDWAIIWLDYTRKVQGRKYIYLNNGGAGHRSDALRHNVEQPLENADVRRDHEATGDGGVDVASADVTDWLRDLTCWKTHTK